MAESYDRRNDSAQTIRAEELAPEELSMGPDDKLVHVRHFYRETRMNMTHNFGDPFLIMIGAVETLASVRARIQAKLGVSDEEIGRATLELARAGLYTEPTCAQAAAARTYIL